MGEDRILKNIIIIFFPLLMIVGCSEPINVNSLVMRNWTYSNGTRQFFQEFPCLFGNAHCIDFGSFFRMVVTRLDITKIVNLVGRTLHPPLSLHHGECATIFVLLTERSKNEMFWVVSRQIEASLAPSKSDWPPLLMVPSSPRSDRC